MRRIGILLFAVAILIPAALALSKDEAKVDFGKLITQLGDEDYAVRKRAEETLLAQGEKAVPALKQALKTHKDAHVRFECTKLLKRIEAEKSRREKPLEEKSRARARMDRQLTEMLRRLQEQGLLGEEELERFRKMFEEGEELRGHAADTGVLEGTVVTGDREIHYRRNADGSVKVTIREDGETKSWEAESLDELKKTAPEVGALIVKHFGNVRVFSGRGRFDLGLDDFPWPKLPRIGSRLRAFPFGEKKSDEPPGGFRLGVWIGEISEALRTHLRLEEDEGVLVEEVVPGSLADRMGVKRLDVIRKLNGVRIAGAAAIRTELAKVEEGGKVTLDVIRRGDPLTLVGSR